MDIKLIKTRAKQELIKNKEGLIRVVFIDGFILLIPGFFTANDYTTIISLIVTLAFLTVPHGLVVSGLKFINGQGEEVDESDSMVGLKRWRELLPTYVLNVLYVLLYTLIPVIAMIIVYTMSGGFLTSNNMISMGLLGVAAVVLGIYVAFRLLLTPYLLEDYGMKKSEAINASRELMRGHVFDYVKLVLSFLPFIIIQALITYGLTYVLMLGLPAFVVEIIVSVVSLIIGVYTYLPLLTVSTAVFYKELAYRAYH